MEAISTSIIGIAGVVIGAVLTAWLGPWVSEKFKLREIYLAPFRKWCSEFYGDLDEFNRRYLANAISYSDYSDVQIIDDYRALHEVLIDAPLWIGKIEKERKLLADNVKRLVDIVDRFWHGLENQHNLQLQNRKDIIRLNNNIRREVAEKLRDHLEDKRQIYPDMSEVLDYLRRKIP